MPRSLAAFTVPGIPLIQPGDDIAQLILEGFDKEGGHLEEGDVVVIAQKIVSKAEGRIVDLNTVVPSARAKDVAKECLKDPREVEVILSESSEIVRSAPGILIVLHHCGIILANAGMDRSNVANAPGEENVLLLPTDPDRSSNRIREALCRGSGKSLGVIINDSLGRPWRLGTTGVALGVSGLPALLDLSGERDLFDRELLVSQQAIADELAAVASLLQGQGAEGSPVAVVRGFAAKPGDQEGAAALLRPRAEDLFR